MMKGMVPGVASIPRPLRMNVLDTNVPTAYQPICSRPISRPVITYPRIVPKVELPISYDGAGLVITFVGALISGVGSIFNPGTLLGLSLMILLTSLAFNAMMFLLMVRVEDPLVPRAMFGILNTLLFFPSGSVYPTQAFPKWLQYISVVDPFTFAVHGFKSLLLKETGLVAVWQDMLYLTIFAVAALAIAVPLFKRTL